MTRSGHASLPRIVMLARLPRPGFVKTRLAEDIGRQAAADLYRDLAAYCCRRMRATAAGGAARLEVHVDDCAEGRHRTPRSAASYSEVRGWLGSGFRIAAQAPGDLGDRLHAAAIAALGRRALGESASPSAVVLVGSDCPDLSGAIVRDALRLLDSSDVVFGPAEDGGYYLVAIRREAAERALPALFGRHVPWGTDRVLEVSVTSLLKAGLSHELLEPLADVDRREDLPVWERVATGQDRAREAPRVSVVIPALSEERHVAGAVRSALEGGAHETIVVDGGSTDATRSEAEAAGARVLEAPAGRARQMNAGAQAASGDVLLFLHADTRLPPSMAEDVRNALQDPRIAAGAFRYRAARCPDDGESDYDLVDELMSLGGGMRHTLFGLPYGDQGVFLWRQDFEDMNGFPEVPVMEDYEMALRLASFGRIATTRSHVVTSSRVWHRHGLMNATLTNAAVIAGYRLGVSMQQLVRLRRRLTG